MEELAEALAGAVPNMISVEFNPLGTDHAVAASLRDVVDKLRRAKERESRERFGAGRETSRDTSREQISYNGEASCGPPPRSG